MSNYPDHFNADAQDRRDRLPEDVLPAELKRRPKLIDDQMRAVSTNPASYAARGEAL